MRPALLKVAALSSTSPAGQVPLSNETTFTRWAYAVALGSAYSAPTTKSRRVGRLRLRTEDGFPEVYILLSSIQDARGRTWIRVCLPQRPNNVTGWVIRSALADFHLLHTKLVVNRRSLRASLYDHGHRVFRARVGVGKPSTPTPAGKFWIREKFRVRGNPLYGARAMGTVLEHAHGLARRGGRRSARHVRARSHPWPPLARLRPDAQPRHSAPL
jgi:hypothetical protein